MGRDRAARDRDVAEALALEHDDFDIEAGADIVEVRDHLGHSSVNTTVGTYSHRSDGSRQATADRLGDIVNGQ